MAITILWDLFKPTSGKWKYGGLAEISGNFRIWDVAELLEEIDASQTEITKGIITKRVYTLVIRDDPKYIKNVNYQHFYTQMYPAHPAQS